MDRRWVLCCFTVLILSCALVGGSQLSTKRTKILPTSVITIKTDPITLTGNAALAAYPGNGTKGNPYRIANLTIDGNETTWCLLIQHTDVHFEVEGCTLSNADEGVRLLNVTFGELRGNHIFDVIFGVDLSVSRNTTVVGNTIVSAQTDGISVSFSHNNTIAFNTLTNNYIRGIALSSSHDNEIHGNTIQDTSLGIKLTSSDNNTISANTFQCVNTTWLEENCEGNTFQGNIVLECDPIPGFPWLVSSLALGALIITLKIRKRVIENRSPLKFHSCEGEFL